MAIGLSEATLLATIFSSALFGYLTAVYGYTIYILRHKQKQNGSFPFVIASVSTGLYILSFAFFIASITRTTIGLWSSDPSAYFFESATALYILRVTLLTAQALLGDAFLIYRLHVLYRHVFLLALPACLLWTGELVAGCGALYAVSTASPRTSVFDVKDWISSFFYLTLATNGFCTISIALRLYISHRRTAQYRISSMSLLSIVEIVLESAAIYSAALVSLVATLLSNSWAQYIVLDLIPHIIGITFFIIIIRAHRKLVSSAQSNSQGSDIAHSFSRPSHRSNMIPPTRRPTIDIPSSSFPTIVEEDSPVPSCQLFPTKMERYVHMDERLVSHGSEAHGPVGPLKIRVETSTSQEVV